MNYEKIILELMGRIQVLEEKVELLLSEKENVNKSRDNKTSTADIRNYINKLKTQAKENGNQFLVLRSGEIHKALKLKNAMPQVCNAMRQTMGEEDVVLHTTTSGNSSTIEIQYKI